MKKKELLVPVGNILSLYQAVHNGADAVYLGGQKFGARKFADNFTNEEIEEAIKFCHLYNVKIYITVNTLIYDDEVPDFIDYVKFLYTKGVDAVIVQDFGMLCLIRELFPQLEIHASTQMNINNQDSIKLLEDLGVKRVVLARELSLEEINNLKTKMEIEVFIHGALCISYSGCCLFSSMIGGRSGNRGECAGSCRLPYRLLKNNKPLPLVDKYLLSTKELNTSCYFEQLMQSSISSFKIEGRMKSPEYVGFITKFYRHLIDQYNETLTVKDISKQDIKELKTLFNREFTKGHLFNETNDNLMNTKSPNHIGITIGKVLKVWDHKIKIKLTDDLHQEDGIRFVQSDKGMMVNFLYDRENRLIKEAKKGDIIFVDNKVHLKMMDVVNKTYDSKLMKRLKNYALKKIGINVKMNLKIGQNLYLSIEDINHYKVEVEGVLVQQAKTAPLSKLQVEQQINKLNDTPFKIEQLDIDMDSDVFVPIKFLNEIRREAIEQLTNKRMEVSNSFKIATFKPDVTSFKTNESSHHISVRVNNLEQLKTCLHLPFTRIYTNDLTLYEQYKDDKRLYYEGSRTHRNTVVSKSLVVQLGDLLPDQEKVADYTMNVVNAYTVYYLQKHNITTVTLSPELNIKQIASLINNYQKITGLTPPLEKIIYGRIDLMIMKHNLLQNACQLNDEEENINKYELEDRKGVHYPVVATKQTTKILSPLLQEFTSITTYQKMGITNFRLQLFDENSEKINQLYESINAYLKVKQ